MNMQMRVAVLAAKESEKKPAAKKPASRSVDPTIGPLHSLFHCQHAGHHGLLHVHSKISRDSKKITHSYEVPAEWHYKDPDTAPSRQLGPTFNAMHTALLKQGYKFDHKAPDLHYAKGAAVVKLYINADEDPDKKRVLRVTHTHTVKSS